MLLTACAGTALAVSFAYLAVELDSPLWQRAERLPAIGEDMELLHEHFRDLRRPQQPLPRRSPSPPGPPPGFRPPGGPGLTPPSPGRPESSPGAAAGIADAPAVPWEGRLAQFVWVPPGAQVFESPRESARPLGTNATILRMPRLARQGDWFKVWRQGRVAWVRIPGYRDDGGPPLGDAPDPPGPLMAREPDPEQLAAARQIFGGRDRSLRWGAVQVLTDAGDPELLALLESILPQVEPAFAARHRRQPIGDARGVIALYEAEAAYRQLQDHSQQILGLPAAGHNDRGLVALYVGGRPTDEVAATLIHELAHLMNRRAIGPQLPPWLDEGISEDLAMSGIVAGQLVPAAWGGQVIQEQELRQLTRRFTLARASLFQTRALLLDGRLPTLRELTALDWPSFVRSESRRVHYDLAGLWVRFFQEGEGGALRPGWQAFLADVAGGGQPVLDRLREHVGRDPELLEANFRAWLLERAGSLLGPP